MESTKRNLFNSFCWYLNVLHLSFVAVALRYVLWFALRPFARERIYAASALTSYHGWIDVPIFGVVAFRREDGSAQFRW